MKMLYAGDLWEHGTCVRRMRAFRRLGFEVHLFDFSPYQNAGGPLSRRLRLRLLTGGQVARCNRDIVDLCARLRPDFVWLDKPIFLWPETIAALRRGGARVVCYICDNPYGTRFEPWFRLLKRTARQCDVIAVPRMSSVADFADARQVVLIPFAFEPFNEFPDPAEQPVVPLSFIGAPYDDRAAFVSDLGRRGLPVLIHGQLWNRSLHGREPNLTVRPAVWGADYRRAIRRSAICLSFVTHHNHDPYAHKSFEITACGSFLLAERSDGHAAMFEEGREAEFFGEAAEAASKARFYLDNPDALAAVALAGCRRAWRSGYSNDERQAALFAAIDPPLGRILTDRARAIISSRRAELGLDP
ncbi:glycosyltransferase [Azospirillum sp. TSO5]|uniref:CgeB family protein n=1 Tax=Azospirillum sp. TSO5 TaxID=716760 RepID=UPI001304B08D|nr:glycosyltransferase [Azospirillum sp. TSO5]